MKKLSKMLLIHWYGYQREVIEFGDINFLTGKTAAGKSTVIDALQLVLLGDTNGNFFNKAANEKSVRTLKSYLYGENGDDGDTGYRYLRKGPFTSYVVLEFSDTERRSSFIAGIVCDCHEDQNFEYKWFTADRTGIPENLFTDTETNVPWNIRKLRSWLKSGKNRPYEVIDTNKRFQQVMLAKYGAVKRKYLVLLKKAVPFTPITDIEKFITESICDVKNNIRVEQMQSDIRQYKNLEADAERTQKRISALTEIEELTRVYEVEKDRYRQQSYIILRAGEEEQKQAEERIRRELSEREAIVKEAEQELQRLQEEYQARNHELENLRAEYHSSDLVRRQKMLEQQIGEHRQKIHALEQALTAVAEQLRKYAADWRNQLTVLERAGLTVPEADSAVIDTLEEQVVVRPGEQTSLTDLQAVLQHFEFASAATQMQQLQETISERAYELQRRTLQLKEEIADLENRVQSLEKGIKPYPRTVTQLKARLERGLFERFGKAVDVPVFADLLEIRDPAWRNAIEGYLDRQKFNLLVPVAYFREANAIYDAIRREDQIFDTGLVDLGKLRREFTKKPGSGSLAEEVETEHPDARLYADYLLGDVMKCEDVRRLNEHRTAITKSVMLYKGYVTRRLNPRRYVEPFIGRRSMQIMLENLRAELAEQKKLYEDAANQHRLLKRAAKTAIMSSFEAEQHRRHVAEAAEIPSIAETLHALEEEYGGLDFTYAAKMEEKIRLAERLQEENRSRTNRCREQQIRADEQRQRLEQVDLPAVQSKMKAAREEILQEFSEDWIRETGEPRFQKELRQTGRVQLTLYESFHRARNQTQTTMDKHLVERRRKRALYNQEYHMPFDTEREDNLEYSGELQTLAEIRLPQYIDQIRDAREKAYNQFRDDFIAKLKSNIESVREQINELNYSLKNSVFGTDRYHFEMHPRAEYRNYYDMITDPMLMDTGGWNLASDQFNRKYQREIDSLFRALIINETEVSAERRAEYERNIRKFTDYKTYLTFDLIVTNEQDEKQRLSRTLLKKSGGETQIPFYISLLASFSQVCRIRSKGKNNTIRVIILDEAFSKMDGERIQESVALLRRFGLQAIFSAPPEKIPDIAPNVDRNIAVYKAGHVSFTRYFDPAEIEDMKEA